MARFPEDDHWPQITFSRKIIATNLPHFPALLSVISSESLERRSSESNKPDSYQNTDCTPDDQIALAADSRGTASIDTINLQLDSEERVFRRVHYMLEHLVPKNFGANWFENSRIPLIQAAAQGDARWVQELLLSFDIEPDIRSFQGWTALQQACSAKSGQVEAVVKQLVDHGADVNAAPGQGYSMTALQAACGGGRRPLVELLLGYGADIHASPAGDGYTALGEACLHGHIEIVQLLLKQGAQVNQDIQPLSGNSALAAAAQNGSMAIIELLLEHRADLDDDPALQRAVFWHHEEVAKRLVELGADVNAAPYYSSNNTYRRTPIAVASSLSMIEYLIAHGADVNGAVLDESGATAVQEAAAYRSTEILEELIRLGGDVNAPAAAIYGRTALQAAAYRGRSCHVRLLVDKHGAAINTPRSSEKPNLTALEAAAHWRAKNQTGRSSAQDVEQEESESLSTVEFLLDRGAELTTIPLHLAAAWGDEELGDLLLKRGADPNLPPNVLFDIWTYRSWGEDRDMGSTVFETARLNGRTQFLVFLENWHKVHQDSLT